MPGSPIVFLESVTEAERSLNQGRRKDFKIDARYYFVDSSKGAIEYLKQELVNRGYEKYLDESIQLVCGEFENEYEKIISEILLKARAGRSIFLLDQRGYSQVPLRVCRKILGELPRSEVILTFAIDWLVDYLSDNAAFLKGVSPIEIEEQQVTKFLESKGLRGHRYLVQRLMIGHLKYRTGAQFFTPFFIRSTGSGRDLWLIHLSKHPTARNVMTSSHWEIQNSSIHPGKAGLDMLGFDPTWEDVLPLDFEFDGNAEVQTAAALKDEIPYRVENLDVHGPVTIDAFYRSIANDTAARIDQIEHALMELHNVGDIEILTPSGQQKRANAKLKVTDRLQLSRQLFFSGLDVKD